VRSRSGNELQLQVTYHDKNNKEVTAKKYGKLIPSFKGRIDTAFSAGGDWSPWSNIYLRPGEAFQSPSPRRYMELQVALISARAERGVQLDWLEIEFDNPLAQQVLGEIFPVQVQPGKQTEFTYYIQPRQIAGTGFDRLLLETSAPVEFKGVWVDGERQEVVLEETDRGFAVTLPAPIRESRLLELRFVGTVFVDATRFDAFLADSRDAALARQRVDSGDAYAEVVSSTNAVRLPVAPQLLANVSIEPRILTPNADGVNDVLRVEFDLVNVLAPRLVGLRVFDMAGRLLQVLEEQGLAGDGALVWDGGAQDGVRVPPGLYVAELRIDGDGGIQSRRRVISVAY